MIALRLPDGSVREFSSPVSGKEIALGIASDAVAIVVNGEVRDLSVSLSEDGEVDALRRTQEEALPVLRHDAAHVLAQSVQELYPDAKVCFGPPISDGFYYDFAREEPFSVEDLPRIEARMHEIVSRDLPFVREVWPRDQALAHFRDLGEVFKAEHISSLPAHQEITMYRQGSEWLDLCRGPHGPSTGWIGQGFALTRVSGAYWLGDSKNAQLQRIYGLCFASAKQLREHRNRLMEAARRDHRRLGREMELFHFQEEAPGSVFWHPSGWDVFLRLTDYLRGVQTRVGYREVSTPELLDRRLWEQSGHWEAFREHMFTSETEDGRTFSVKPMNCPGAIQIFKRGVRSYRDLPFLLSEFGKVHRYEPSGSLQGLLRLRAFTQDDAHIFCTPAQTRRECGKIANLILGVYRDFGFTDVQICFSDRPSKRIGSDAVWDSLEGSLRGALEDAGLDYTCSPGEGAFYGPKLEFVLCDAIGRRWQCGTIQVDMNLPERLDVSYTAADGTRQRPVLLHRALFGSQERFLGILLEHHAGCLPLWLSPIQVAVASISAPTEAYARRASRLLEEYGLRVCCDVRSEKISSKIRSLSQRKTPVIAVVGTQEAERETVVLRFLGRKEQLRLGLVAAAEKLQAMGCAPTCSWVGRDGSC